MDSEPQNFSGAYPLAGERIGPAWRDAWKELFQHQWTEGRPLARRVALRHGLSDKTIANLLWGAVKAGQLEQRLLTDSNKCARAWYRVK